MTKNDSYSTVDVEKNKNAGSTQDEAFQVLVVEDDSLILHLVPKVLKSLEVSVDVAENGLQAQSKVLARNYDLVITDIHMPKMNGLELLLWLKKHRPNIERIVMTGYDITEVLSNKELGGVADYLTKPFKIIQLQEAVMKSMQRLKSRNPKRPKIASQLMQPLMDES